MQNNIHNIWRDGKYYPVEIAILLREDMSMPINNLSNCRSKSSQPSINTEKLTDFSLALIACPELEKQHCDFITPKQRKPLCLISNDREGVYQKKIDSYLKEHEIILDGYIELGSTEAVKRSVISNLGVAYLPRYTIEDDLAAGTLKEIKTKLVDRKITSIFAYHRNKWISPALDLFIQLLIEQFKENNHISNSKSLLSQLRP